MLYKNIRNVSTLKLGDIVEEKKGLFSVGGEKVLTTMITIA